MTDQEYYNLIVAIIQDSENIIWRSSLSLEGEIRISDSIIQFIETAYENGFILYNKISEFNGNLDFVDIYDCMDKILSYTMTLKVPNKDVAIVKNIDELLRISIFLTISPILFYDIDKKTNILPKEYTDTIKFATFLVQISDHYTDNGDIKKCLFYAGIKISIIIKYNTKDIRILPGIDELILSCDNPPHLEERKKILKEIIVQNSLGKVEEKIFVYLLKRFNIIKQKFDQDWSLFISDFSISKIIDALEIKILNITDKITTSLSELQKTMITIPLAIIFIAPQFADIASNQYKNILLLVSLWIFLIFTLIFFWFHKKNMKLIEDELDTIIKQTEDDYPQLTNRIVNIFKSLKKKCKFQSLYRKFIGSMMWISVITVTIFSITGNDKLFNLMRSFFLNILYKAN